MIYLAWLALAGGLGTLARYGLSHLVQRAYGGELPLGTLLVNLIGCLLFGLVWSLAEQRWAIDPQTRLVVLTGFMGAFTTFSTFAFETSILARDGQLMLAGANIVLNNVLGLAALVLGMGLARLA